ncbi:uncharacterized protein LOC134332667 [Trichomycterus rosablanca]|uniref:uncharacterized protein LOC134332667 n=1 Tax=Trichomycterus rosablanca TaxID=2290929 RepID=UPI002F3544C4
MALQTSFDSWAEECQRECGRKNKEKEQCTGVRTTHSRHFINGLPCLMVISMVTTTSGLLPSVLYPVSLPSSITIMGERYQPAAITYYLTNKIYLICFHRLHEDNQWCLYDGAEELSRPGHGEVKATASVVQQIFSSTCQLGHLLCIRADVDSPQTRDTDEPYKADVDGPQTRDTDEPYKKHSIYQQILKAERWCNENKHHFKGEVAPPPLLYMTRDEAEEALHKFHTLQEIVNEDDGADILVNFSFVFKEIEDMHFFMQNVRDKMKLRVCCEKI